MNNPLSPPAPAPAPASAAAPGRVATTDPTRTIAFDSLRDVLERRRPLEEALDRADPPSAPPSGRASPRDRAAAHRLAAAVLRRVGTLDAVIEPLLSRAPPPPVRIALLMGAAQLLLLETPPHAAVGTIVTLLRERRLTSFAGLANAVLRRVATAGAAALAELDPPRLDIPAWLWSSWGDRARAIAEALVTEAPLDLTPRDAEPDPALLAGGERLPTGSLRFPAGTRVSELFGFAAGAFWIQDAAAALPVRLLNPRPGERIADLCAAPGGKTAQICAAGARVHAVERDNRRIARLRDNLSRLGFTPEIVEADAAAWTPPAPLDAVLLDAPCSATGTARRHPDVLRTKRPNDIPALAAAQDRLLAAASAMLRPGGRLVYAVCSLQPEEGPFRAAAAARLGLVPSPFTPDELSVLPEARTPEGWLRTDPALWPERGGMDGFFAARFLKPG